MVGKSHLNRSGQTAVFLMMALVILFFAAIWSADIHRILFVKDRTQNAGDAAALAAARWQASSLNLLGELNLMHALALAMGDFAAVDLITNTQARLCFTGPMVGLAAAQQAAKLNGIYVNPEYSDFLSERADIVRNQYAATIGAASGLTEPYPDAWSEYSAMLRAIADDGVAAGPDNAVFFSDPDSGHLLLDRAFYEAIAGRSWCWFFNHAPGLLEQYTTYTWWPGLPARDAQPAVNSEIFGLGVSAVASPLRRLLPQPQLGAALAEAGMLLQTGDPDGNWRDPDQIWYVYNRQDWMRWDAMQAPFPVVGPVRQEYDYQGADAVIRVEAGMDRLSPGVGGRGTRDTITWTAAAKPFGYLNLEGGRETPDSHGIVLPAFRQVRLMPVDAASTPGGGSFDLRWRRHIIEHLPVYLSTGPGALDTSCWYCARLQTWEDAAFRREGVDWLSLYSDRCTVTPPAGGGRGGGTRRAH